MNKAKINQTKKTGFWSWVHKYRIKLAGFLFIVILPIAFIVTVYVGAYVNNNKVHFDVEVSESTEFINSFREIDELDPLYLTFDWIELKYPTLNEDTQEWFGGFYTFSMFYTANEGYNIVSVNATFVLQTQWTEMRQMIAQQTLSTSERYFVINFNYDLPTRPLWFVNVTDPILYIKLDYTYQTPTGQINTTEYVHIDLSDFNPESVLPS